MGSIYDRAEIYDLFEDEKRYQAYKKHWETSFEGKSIKSMLDVSIGSGSVTIPVMNQGIELSKCFPSYFLAIVLTKWSGIQLLLEKLRSLIHRNKMEIGHKWTE